MRGLAGGSAHTLQPLKGGNTRLQVDGKRLGIGRVRAEVCKYKYGI